MILIDKIIAEWKKYFEKKRQREVFDMFDKMYTISKTAGVVQTKEEFGKILYHVADTIECKTGGSVLGEII